MVSRRRSSSRAVDPRSWRDVWLLSVAAASLMPAFEMVVPHCLDDTKAKLARSECVHSFSMLALNCFVCGGLFL
ncbi:hypothetical protein QJS10_CPB17g02237 [Acorus calamus]|uniref:Uncharacterized protein n=1 Tax=Acorus calamus TaxID=4465 RepID=A0AAV9CWQ5_ACOCL|nr:hypothetical protein QJS10_CPB17g02237 [Acorus calamus]